MTHDNGAYVTLRQQVAGLLNPHCPAMNNSLECADCLSKADAAIETTYSVLSNIGEAFWREHPNASAGALLNHLERAFNAR